MMKTTIRVGITGESGFIGRHLAAAVRADGRFAAVPFVRKWFDSPEELENFASRCDAIVHLAAVSRDDDGEKLYRTNLELTAKLIDAARSVPEIPAVFLGSTTHIAREAPYHASKRDAMALLRTRLPRTVELLMPNTFGPGARPYWNSVVATFCAIAAAGGAPPEIRDVPLALIPVEELCARILAEIARGGESRTVTIPHRYAPRLPELWGALAHWRDDRSAGTPPSPPETPFERDLLAAFESYR